MALEAQLSPITDDTITTRTERMLADGVTSCWFSDRPRPPWLGTVPSLRLATTDAGLLVAEGLVKFTGGSWTAVPPVPVAEFLRWAFSGKVEQHAPRSPLGYPARQLARVWTARTYVAAEDAHLVEVRRREQERERRLAEQRAKAAKRRAEIDASNVVARAEAVELAAAAEEQVRLAPSGPAEVSHHVLKMNRGVRRAIAYLAREFGIAAEIGWSSSDPRWAGGTPLIAEDGTPVAVVDPAPSLLKGEAFRLLAGMLLLFSTAADVQRFDRTTRGARKPRVPVDGWKTQHTGPEPPTSPAAPAAAPKGRAPRLVSRPCPRAADVDAE
nr:hypothetical protein KPHV_08320 [Kitasatospora purpeofusca]